MYCKHSDILKTTNESFTIHRLHSVHEKHKTDQRFLFVKRKKIAYEDPSKENPCSVFAGDYREHAQEGMRASLPSRRLLRRHLTLGNLVRRRQSFAERTEVLLNYFTFASRRRDVYLTQQCGKNQS